MADDLMRRSAEAAQTESAQTTQVPTTAHTRRESRADRARRLVYRGRFAIFYFLLALVAGAAITSFVLLMNRGSPAPAPAWSEWEPQGSPERRASQIGDRISDPYRLPSGDPLVSVTYAGPPSIAGPDGTPVQISALAVQNATTDGPDDVDAIPAATNVMYILCGLGNACSIEEGEPSAERHQLLRRQALEIALYTLKYIENTESVLLLLPPRPDGRGGTAVLLDRSDVAAALDRPLKETLPAPIVPGVGEIEPEEGRAIDRITRPHVYQFRPIQGPDGGVVLVLSPVLT